MTVRFTDKDKFHDKWYRNLTPVQKCIWEYFVSECNHAGILEYDIKAISFSVNADITMDDIKYFEEQGKIVILDSDKLYIPNFVLFQQRINDLSELNPNNRCHKSIINQLEKYGVIKGHTSSLKGVYKEHNENQDIVDFESSIDAPLKPLDRGLSKGICISNSKSNSNSKDIYCNIDFEKCFEIYQETCTNLIPLRFERRSKAILTLLSDFMAEIGYDFEYFKNLCQTANILKKIVNTHIDFKMLLNNHAGIMSGKYGKTVKDYDYGG